ncbi:MAG: DUF4130 domain-containing protein, partial [Treponema sp.]|nr:DUF4130 domain-containing protein [Treponema sp.]
MEGSPAAFPDLRHSLSAALLFELSADAFDALIHAWMSELPIGAEMARFAWRVIAAAQTEAGLSSGDTGASAVSGLAWAAGPEARHGAEQAAFDRGDPDVRTVLEAAYKARREIDRLMGLLRFSPRSWHGSPGGGPVYVARCSPDHYILPGLAEHFTRRFGDCPWAIID